MVEPGFSNPVMDAQTVFRAVLDAMAAPGRVLQVPPVLAPGPALASRAVLLALTDGATPVWLDGAAEDLAPWLRFHTGPRIVADPGAALFAFAADAARCPSLDAFDPGSDAFPDRSATLLIEVPALEDDGAVRLCGPGIPDWRGLSVAGLPDGFWAQWESNHARFPAGIDLVLGCGNRLAALPRSISVEAPCMSR